MILILFEMSNTSNILLTSPFVVTDLDPPGWSAVLRAAGNVLPRGAKASACAGEEAFLLFVLGVLIEGVLIEFRGAEEGSEEDNKVDG